MESFGGFFQHISTPILILIGILYAGGAAAGYFKPGAGEKLDWDNRNAAHGLENVLVWAGVKVYRGVSKVFRGALNALEEASADVGEWFTGGRGAHS